MLQSLDEGRLPEIAGMSTRNVKYIQRVRAPLSSTSAEERARLGSLSINIELRERLSREAKTSTQ